MREPTTKAHITEGREGTLFNKVGLLTQKTTKLDKELQLKEEIDTYREKFVPFRSKKWQICTYCNHPIGYTYAFALPPQHNDGDWGEAVHKKCLSEYAEAKVKNEILPHEDENYNWDF